MGEPRSAGIEGRLHLNVLWDGRRAAGAAVRSTRPLHASRVLEGRPLAEALARVPLLFGVCGQAQSVAAVQAAEAALGAAPSPSARRGRTLLLLAEVMQEHLWRLWLDWPPLYGLPPAAPAFGAWRRAQATAAAALLAAPGWRVPGGEVPAAVFAPWVDLCDEWEARLGAQVPDLALTDPAALGRWLQTADADSTRLLRAVWADGRWGASAVPLMPPMHAALLAELLTELAADESFAAHPHRQGQPLETGALARRQRHPLLQALLAAEGNTLRLRVLARWLELAAALRAMRECLAGETADDWSGALALGGAGAAWVETARGLLLHRVALDGERVGRYWIVAPTEWNFHPHGAFVQGMAGLAAADRDALARQARRLVLALDPCVAYDVELQDA